MRKRILSLIILAIFIITFVPLSISAAVVDSGFCGDNGNGDCGDNVAWTLDDERTLLISGTGNMGYYHYTQAG